MLDFTKVSDYIKENFEEAITIIEAERLTIVNNARLKFLHHKFLFEFWKERPIKQNTFVIFFHEDAIANLDFPHIKNNLENSITGILKTYKYIEVDANFNIISKNADKITEELNIKLSNSRKVVFFFGFEGIEIAVRGKIIEKVNFFYDESDRAKYLKKHHIEDLNICIKEYEKSIMDPGNNKMFFASKGVVSKIQPLNPPKNILHNKPEKLLRDNLIAYLNHNTQHTFTKEIELNNQRELDLYTEVDGRKYLIEVKWLGQSINDDETGFSQKITDFSAREGVTQTLEYIKHLFEDMTYTVHCGYLCVFDVRENKTIINYNSFNFIRQDLQPYYHKHFCLLDPISLDYVY